MKKLIIISIFTLLLTGCGVHTVVSGVEDKAEISFVAPTKKVNLNVKIDDNTYNVQAVYQRAWRKDRNIKKTVKNTIVITPGKHNVEVRNLGEVVFQKQIFVSTGEHKIIEL
ncbi:MAG: hypothetical protein HUJ95_00505 [Bacteroidales bacterium]|mgnify:CR=1 FL=1|nr:hypothetical protein [Bacteroidales bacterium]